MAGELVTATYNLIFVDQILVAGGGTGSGRCCWPWALTAALPAPDRGSSSSPGCAAEAVLAATHSARFLWHVLRLPIGVLSAALRRRHLQPGGRQLAVADLISGPLATTLVGLLMVVFYGGVMLAFDPVLAAVGVAIGSLNLAGIAAAQRMLRRREHQDQARPRPARRLDDARRPDHRDDQGGRSEHEALVRLTAIRRG